MSTGTKERRRYFRHRIESPLKLRVDTHPAPVRAEVADISLGGLSFLWAKRLKRGHVISVTIPVKEKFFEIHGKVSYCKEDRKSGRYRMGIEFLDETSEFKAKLAEEALEILQFRKSLAKEVGHAVSEEEAARKWIQRYAEHFSNHF